MLYYLHPNFDNNVLLDMEMYFPALFQGCIKTSPHGWYFLNSGLVPINFMNYYHPTALRAASFTCQDLLWYIVNEELPLRCKIFCRQGYEMNFPHHEGVRLLTKIVLVFLLLMPEISIFDHRRLCELLCVVTLYRKDISRLMMTLMTLDDRKIVCFVRAYGNLIV